MDPVTTLWFALMGKCFLFLYQMCDMRVFFAKNNFHFGKYDSDFVKYNSICEISVLLCEISILFMDRCFCNLHSLAIYFLFGFVKFDYCLRRCTNAIHFPKHVFFAEYDSILRHCFLQNMISISGTTFSFCEMSIVCL